MNLKTFSWSIWKIFLTVLAALLMLHPPPAAAALESPSTLTCNATQQDDGSIRYQLSQPPGSSKCDTCWETENRTVIALLSGFIPGLVLNLTDQSITLRDCVEYLYYKADCHPAGLDLRGTNCTINCSVLPDPVMHPPSDNCCPDKLTAGLIIGVSIAAAVIALVPVICFTVSKCKKKEPVSLTASYTSVDEQVMTTLKS